MRLAVVALCAVACGGGGSGFTCEIGQLSGTWRFHYTQSDGNCGTIADETVILGGSPTPSGCTTTADTVSPDRCRLDTAFTCPLNGGVSGSQQWTLTLTQASASELAGSGTVQASASGTTCRSTYQIDVTKI